MSREHVLLHNGKVRRKSLTRRWNQLSRLQRSIFYTILIVVVVPGLIFKLFFNDTGPNYSEEVKRSAINLKESNNQQATPAEKGIEFKGPQNERQRAVVDAFKHAWKGYKSYAWGHDMLRPLNKGYKDWFSLGLTIVDGLDTMFIMKLEDEYKEARDWVEQHLNFEANKYVNLFEVTIRVLGGLLGIHHLSGDRMFLGKAYDLGNRLLPAFGSWSGVPYSDVNLKTGVVHSPHSPTSEVTTIQLEFRDLSRCMRDPKFENMAWMVSKRVHTLPKTDGLVPQFIDVNAGNFKSDSTITLGARADSYYEYLLKQWLQTGKGNQVLKDDFLEAMVGVQKHLLKRSGKRKLLFLGELANGKEFRPKMDHLACFLPGTLALGVKNGMPMEHMKIAEELLYTCYQTYAVHPTFLAAEISSFNMNEGSDIYVESHEAHNLLRPEFVESLYLMYYVTGNTTYQDWGWNVFQGFEKYAKVANGYTSLGNVMSVHNTQPKNLMESFFLAETLKYLYLLFSNDRRELDLDKFVLNTEAHPLLIYKEIPKKKKWFGIL